MLPRMPYRRAIELNLIKKGTHPSYNTDVIFFRFNFLAEIDFELKKVVRDIELAEFLADEGVLVPGNDAETFMLSALLVRQLVVSIDWASSNRLAALTIVTKFTNAEYLTKSIKVIIQFIGVY
ncbi:5907_t:CDS:2, partial [Ambispora leptoticha]